MPWDEGDTYVVSLGLTPEKANMDVYLLASYEVTLNEPPEVIGELVEVLSGINQFIDIRVLPTVRSPAVASRGVTAARKRPTL
jgi:hypothetical protein